jgi:DNA invertase Pin-like site-specific DNA recombinase
MVDVTPLKAFTLPTPPPFHDRPKLTPSQRDQIRQRIADGESVRELAAEFGVSARTIRQNS